MAATFSFSFPTFNAYSSEAFSGFGLKGLKILLRLSVEIRASNYNTSVSGAELYPAQDILFQKLTRFWSCCPSVWLLVVFTCLVQLDTAPVKNKPETMLSDTKHKDACGILLKCGTARLVNCTHCLDWAHCRQDAAQSCLVHSQRSFGQTTKSSSTTLPIDRLISMTAHINTGLDYIFHCPWVNLGPSDLNSLNFSLWTQGVCADVRVAANFLWICRSFRQHFT